MFKQKLYQIYIQNAVRERYYSQHRYSLKPSTIFARLQKNKTKQNKTNKQKQQKT